MGWGGHPGKGRHVHAPESSLLLMLRGRDMMSRACRKTVRGGTPWPCIHFANSAGSTFKAAASSARPRRAVAASLSTRACTSDIPPPGRTSMRTRDARNLPTSRNRGWRYVGPSAGSFTGIFQHVVRLRGRLPEGERAAAAQGHFLAAQYGLALAFYGHIGSVGAVVAEDELSLALLDHAMLARSRGIGYDESASRVATYA